MPNYGLKEVIKIREEEEYEPTIAPSINNDQELEEDAAREEIDEGASTSVTQLVIDRTSDK
jgi:hypothetical protein